MSDDIVERLRKQADDSVDDLRAALFADAADEIERLRSLIGEWAYAESRLEDSGYWTDEYDKARTALLRAVGR